MRKSPVVLITFAAVAMSSLGYPLMPPESQVTYTMTLLSEQVEDYVAVRPGQDVSVAAVIRRDDNGAVVSGVTVTFAIQNPTGQWVLSGSPAVTSDCGQAHVTVRCTTFGSAVLKATWGFSGPPWGPPPPPLAQDTMDIWTVNTNCDQTVDDPISQVWRLPNNCGIKYTSFTAYQNAVNAGQSAWTGSGWAAFTQVEDDSWNIEYRDICDPINTARAQAVWLTASKRRVEFNKYWLDPCPGLSTVCVRHFPRVDPRHHMGETAAHEIGHCLGLYLHNGTDRGALMYGGLIPFFECGTTGPLADEINAMQKPVPDGLGYSQ